MKITNKKKKIISGAIILFAVSLLFPIKIEAKQKIYGTITNAITVVRVYDGDTFYVNIDGFPEILGKNIGIRINGIDTPEIRTRNIREKRMGYKAKRLLQKLFSSAKKIELRNARRGKYFRIVADVYLDGKNVKDLMINAKLAYEYNGGKKRQW